MPLCPAGFHLAPRRAQNGARPGFRAILHGECALGALEGRFWFPGRSGHIGGRASAQGVHPRAVEALGAHNADLPLGWSLSTPSSPKPHVPQSVGVRADRPRPVFHPMLPLSSGPPLAPTERVVARDRLLNSRRTQRTARPTCRLACAISTRCTTRRRLTACRPCA